MKPRILALLAVGLLAAPSGAQALAVSVDNFTVITDATFINVGGLFTSAAGGGVTVAGTPARCGYLDGSSASATPSNPGDGVGWACGFHEAPVVTLDFDVPLAAFGASFMHFGQSFPFGSPGIVAVYDMPHGAGNLLGQASSGGNSEGYLLIDFVGVWNAAAAIRSAVLSVETGLIAVDGYGVSFTPIPEPGTLALLGLGLAGLGLSRRREAH